MNERVLNKINHFRQLATSPAKIGAEKIIDTFRSNDSLSKAIRNPQEAAIFLIELDAIIKSASKK